jgi:hypothetical protein
MLHRWMSADDKRRLLEKFLELEATLAHLDRYDNQIALLTVGTGTEDRERRSGPAPNVGGPFLDFGLSAEAVDFRFVLNEPQDDPGVGVVDVAMGDAHLGPLVPQSPRHGSHPRADRPPGQ